MNPSKFIDKILFIGAGAVCTSLLELWMLCKSPFLELDMIFIDGVNLKDKAKEILSKYDNKVHVKLFINKENIEDIKKYLDNRTLLIDLSVNVDSGKLIIMCKEKNSYYISTSIESFTKKDDNVLSKNKEKLAKRTIASNEYELNEKLDHIEKDNKHVIMENMGMNPGIISALAYRCIELYYNQKTGNKEKLKNSEFPELCRSLGLNKIIISEHDTQITKEKLPKNYLWNTWSVGGLYSEGLNPIEISVEADKENDTEQDIHTYTNIRGIDAMGETVGIKFEKGDNKPKVFSFKGYLIPHSECITIPDSLQIKEDNKVVYSPECYYVYRLCPACMESIDKVKKHNYDPCKFEWHVLDSSEIVSGYDSIGTYMEFNNGDNAWYGSILDIETCRKMNFEYATATLLPVASGINSGLIAMFSKYNDSGVITPENVNYRDILSNSEKYLGNLIFWYNIKR